VFSELNFKEKTHGDEVEKTGKVVKNPNIQKPKILIEIV